MNKLMEVGMHDIDALAVCLMKPVHVSDDIARNTDLLYSRDPLIDVRYDWPKKVTIGCYDLAQVRKNRVINVVLSRCAVPWSVGVVRPQMLYFGSNCWIDGYRPPIGPNLRRQYRMRQHAN